MSDASLPEGFRWSWHGDTVRVNLPELTVTSSHVYEPVLSRADSDRLSDAISGHVASHRGAPPLARVVIVRDPRYGEDSIKKFRGKLSAALTELALEPEIVIETTDAAPAKPAAPPPAAPVIDAGAETDHGIEVDLEALSESPAAEAALPEIPAPAAPLALEPPSPSSPTADAPSAPAAPSEKKPRDPNYVPAWRRKFEKGKK